MRYIVDHDFHIHSNLSPCGKDPTQTPENILKYAKRNGLRKIAVTDHFWDKAVPTTKPYYQEKGFDLITKNLPLPQCDGIEFLFGCEADMDCNGNVGLSPANADKLDFIIVSTTHMHIWYDSTFSLEDRADAYVKRFQALLDSQLPLQKTGVAHLTNRLIARDQWDWHMQVLDMIPDETFQFLFRQAQEKGLGIELNIELPRYEEKDIPRILRPYQIAKACGCKFYLGSDAHRTDELDETIEIFRQIIDLLDLQECDKFIIK